MVSAMCKVCTIGYNDANQALVGYPFSETAWKRVTSQFFKISLCVLYGRKTFHRMASVNYEVMMGKKSID